MSRYGGILIGVILSLMVLPCSAFGGELYGRVVDSNGEGLPQASVMLAGSGVATVVHTGPGGEYHILNTPASGSFTINASHSGHAAGALTGSFSQSELSSIQLEPHSITLSGTVLSREGFPLSGVRVNAGALGEVTTDSSGKFSFSGTYGQDYKITVHKNYYFFHNGIIEGTLLGMTERTIVGEMD